MYNTIRYEKYMKCFRQKKNILKIYAYKVGYKTSNKY